VCSTSATSQRSSTPRRKSQTPREETIQSSERRKEAEKKPRNRQLPAHLSRYEVKLPVPADLKTCPTQGERKILGFDWQETLEIVPPKIVVRRTWIPKRACPTAPECGVVEVDRPIGLVEGNRYDTQATGVEADTH
jgi:zinc-finger binding domain of transposase IS66